jgi:hypothetical protein
MTFLARYNSDCADRTCDEAIERGDIVEYIDDQLVHEGCRPPAPRAPRAVCEECFIEISPSGACGCGVLT